MKELSERMELRTEMRMGEEYWISATERRTYNKHFLSTQESNKWTWCGWIEKVQRYTRKLMIDLFMLTKRKSLKMSRRYRSYKQTQTIGW